MHQTSEATILVVDDIAANRNLLRETLEPSGYEVLLAANGETAVKVATRARPDLILLDVNMPGIDGFETCRRLKLEEPLQGIPIIFITASNETESTVEAFRAGGIDYITKPFRAEEVLMRVETHLKISRLTHSLLEKNQELTRLNEDLRAEMSRRKQAEQSLSIIEESQVERFHTSGTLRPDAPSYVERKADADLLDGLLRGEFCYVLTSRQMGKSSLMVRTAMRLRKNECKVVTLDLTAIGQNLSPEQWYDGLISRLGWQLELEDELEDFWEHHARLSPVQRFFAAIRQSVLPKLPGRLAIFVDELDMVRSLPFPTAEFFAAIREVYNRRSEDPELCRITFCLLGVATPSELIDDSRITPFNIGQRIDLEDFTLEEAAPLARGLGREPGAAMELIQRIHHWTGGHPYLTQKLCRSVLADESIQTSAALDDLCGAQFFTAAAVDQDDNLIFVRERLLRGTTDPAQLLGLYSRIRSGEQIEPDEASSPIAALRLSGIVRTRGGILRIRNRIYENVFDLKWVQSRMIQ